MGAPEHRQVAGRMKVISWNLLRRVGAGVEDVAALIRQHCPDLLLMQEATAEMAHLPALVGGHFYREPMHGRIYGLAAWSPHPLAPPQALPLPVSTMPGRVPPRISQLVRFGGVTFANVHLSHGQFLNRWQLLHITRAIEGPAVIVGDYNAVGPIKLAGFKDVGPREPTHIAGNVIAVRLDRCMARGLHCTSTEVLDRGPSDHHPIVLDLRMLPEAVNESMHVSMRPSFREALRRRSGPLPARVSGWLRALPQSRNAIRVPRALVKAAALREAGVRFVRSRRAAARPEERL